MCVHLEQVLRLVQAFCIEALLLCCLLVPLLLQRWVIIVRTLPHVSAVPGCCCAMHQQGPEDTAGNCRHK